ncbi:MAG TPA: PspC domain-containing protein [Anaerolineaceae bacterium]|nr:PspC domain-containing protein [Anaerolineaceae bacterium]
MKKLYRSRNNRMIAGVCAGLADYFEIDPTIVRIIFVILVFAGLGGMLVYAILWLITPEEPLPGDATTIDISGKESD